MRGVNLSKPASALATLTMRINHLKSVLLTSQPLRIGSSIIRGSSGTRSEHSGEVSGHNGLLHLSMWTHDSKPGSYALCGQMRLAVMNAR